MKEGFDIVETAQVAADAGCLPAIFPDGGGHLFETLLFAADQNDFGALPGQGLCNGAADTPAGAGDQGDATRQIE